VSFPSSLDDNAQGAQFVDPGPQTGAAPSKMTITCLHPGLLSVGIVIVSRIRAEGGAGLFAENGISESEPAGRDVSGQVISTGKLRPQVISAIEPRRA
jgi:hypothetical protein